MGCPQRLLRVSMLCLCVSASTTAASGQEFSGTRDRLEPGDRLLAGESLTSVDGRYELAYQTDGNLVLYDAATGVALWWTGTVNEVPGEAVMQGDGNFVVYNALGTPVWWSGTVGYENAFLIVQDDANLVVYAPGEVPVWWSAGTLANLIVLTGQILDATTGVPIPGAVISINGRYATTADAFGRYSVLGWPDYGDRNFTYASADGYVGDVQYIYGTFENIYLNPIDCISPGEDVY